MRIIQEALVRALPMVPRGLMRRIAGRYIAGESRADLLRVALSLQAQGLLSTADVLGENVTTREAAAQAAGEYLRLVEGLAAQVRSSQVSIKLTLLGLRLGEEMAYAHLEEIAVLAERRGVSICLDMEDSSTTDAILRIFRRARERHGQVEVAIQAYLHRSVADMVSLLPLRPAVRVCKGIYSEPETVALQDRRAIRENYLRIVNLLLDGGGYPAIATHDPWLVDACLKELLARASPPESHELQMLLGVGESLRPRILAAGSRLRIYCPYGPDWYAYSLRRLKENPKMVGYIFRNVVSGGILRRGHLSPKRG